MRKYTQKLKKVLLIGLVVSIIIPYGALMQPKKAEAIGSFTGLDLINDIKELPLDIVGSFIKGIVVAAITENIINWINSGFEGNPSFIDNPEAFFSDISNEITGAMINELDLNFLCEPFSAQIQLALATPDLFRERAQCTLLDVVENYDAFMDDFNEGGWAGWISMTQYPQNNPYGAYLMVNAELSQRQMQAEQDARDDLAQGQGYRSAKECDEYDSNDESYDDKENYVGSYRAGGITGCKRYKVQTPGITIKAQMQDSIGTSLKQLEVSDEITDAIASIVMALINQVVEKGVRGLTEKQGDSHVSTWGQRVDEDTGLTAVEEDVGNLKQTVENATKIQEAIKEKIGEEEIEIIDRILVCYDEQIVILSKNYEERHIKSIEKRIEKLTDLKQTAADAETNIETLNSIDSGLATTTTIQGLSKGWKKYDKYEKDRRGGDMMGSILDDIDMSEMMGKFQPDNKKIMEMIIESIKASLEFGASGGGGIPGFNKIKTVSPYAFMNSSRYSLLAVEDTDEDESNGVYGGSGNTPSPSSSFVKELLDEEADCKENLNRLKEGKEIGWGSGAPGAGGGGGGGDGSDNYYSGRGYTTLASCKSDFTYGTKALRDCVDDLINATIGQSYNSACAIDPATGSSYPESPVAVYEANYGGDSPYTRCIIKTAEDNNL